MQDVYLAILFVKLISFKVWLTKSLLKFVSLSYKSSAGALVSTFINDLPRQAEAAAKIIEQFDKNDFQQVLNFAKAANGGRDIQ